MLITPGIKKNLFIDMTLATKINTIIGPSIESIKETERVLSIMLKSLENLELRFPVDVVSKYDDGLLTRL